MRVIVYGIGAIGGAIAARLALAGTNVIGIARGGMLDEIYAQGGLNLVTSEQSTLVPMSVVAHPDDITWQEDDVVLLTMKSNDTEAALRALVGAGVQSQTIICAQNGVVNEVMALRQFPNVVAMVMMMPAQYLKAGKVIAPGAPKTGLFDLGNFPSGTDKVPTELVEALHTAGFDCDVRKDAMAGKYGKLLMNLGNIVEAALGKDARQGDWNKRARKEGEQVLKAAGIDYYTVDKDNPRRALMNVAEVPGYTRVGSSSTQSLLRGTGEIETDYLNGEIVMLGRIHGVRTPVNAAFVRVARQMVQNGTAPGAFSEDEVQRLVTACEAVS
jgi:2-dehydropantoate 2-reductase